MPVPNSLAASLTLSLALTATAHADEGMWMPSQLSELAKPLRDAGFRGDPRDLAAVTQPLLSAMVKVGGGTGAFVSGECLLLTNHHVAYGVIQYNTSAKENLIGQGFIAKDRGDERAANPDFRVLVVLGFNNAADIR